MGFYPYESQIEQDFAFEFEKHKREGLLIEPQVEVTTQWGRFRLDFVVGSEKRIAIECDGLEFHDARRDEIRDAVLIGSGSVHAIYRIPGPLIVYHLAESLFVLSLWEPDIFEPRSLEVLKRKVAPNTERLMEGFNAHSEYSPYVALAYHVNRRAADQVNGRGWRYFWRSVFEVAKRTTGGIDDIGNAMTPEMFDRIRKENGLPPNSYSG